MKRIIVQPRCTMHPQTELLHKKIDVGQYQPTHVQAISRIEKELRTWAHKQGVTGKVIYWNIESRHGSTLRIRYQIHPIELTLPGNRKRGW